LYCGYCPDKKVHELFSLKIVGAPGLCPPVLYGCCATVAAADDDVDKNDELCAEHRRTSFHGGGTSNSGRSTATMTSTSVRSSRHHNVCGLQSPDRRREYVKKPLNAFMLFMKEKRQRVIDECTLKESAAINQILGRKVLLLIFHFTRSFPIGIA